MSGLAEIQQAILKLSAWDRGLLWEWLQKQEKGESPALLAAVDEGIRSLETDGGVPAEVVYRQITTWASR